jgi:L-threonylcarbamoyladenylate synthase
MLTEFLEISGESIKKAATVIQNGGLVIYPTDTVYGLGCDPFNEGAVNRLAGVKRRNRGSLPVLVGTLESAKELGEIGDDVEALALRFWPGPLTIVVSSRVEFPLQVIGPDKMIGLRVPRRDDTLELISKSGGSLVGTSANVSGTKSLRQAKDALDVFEGRVDVVLDGGSLTTSVESTVVKSIRAGGVQILREGGISREDIAIALKSNTALQD